MRMQNGEMQNGETVVRERCMRQLLGFGARLSDPLAIWLTIASTSARLIA